jgi:hypothetical protein
MFRIGCKMDQIRNAANLYQNRTLYVHKRTFFRSNENNVLKIKVIKIALLQG